MHRILRAKPDDKICKCGQVLIPPLRIVEFSQGRGILNHRVDM